MNLLRDARCADAFCMGFVAATLVYAATFALTACVGGRPFSDKEKQLYAVQIQISRLTAQEQALKKAIAEDRKAK